MITSIETSNIYKVIFEDEVYYVTIVEKEHEDEISISDDKNHPVTDDILFGRIESYVDKILHE